MANPMTDDKQLEKLASAVVAARAEYQQRYNAYQALKPFLDQAIRAADEADNALQDYLQSKADAQVPA